MYIYIYIICAYIYIFIQSFVQKPWHPIEPKHISGIYGNSFQQCKAGAFWLPWPYFRPCAAYQHQFFHSRTSAYRWALLIFYWEFLLQNLHRVVATPVGGLNIECLGGHGIKACCPNRHLDVNTEVHWLVVWNIFIFPYIWE